MTQHLVSLTGQHLWLVLVSLLLSLMVGLPLGRAGTRSRAAAHLVASVPGVIQTLPTVALRCLLIPWTGIGVPGAPVETSLHRAPTGVAFKARVFSHALFFTAI